MKQISYLITGQAQNRINTLMIKHAPQYNGLIWSASFVCVVMPMLVFGRSLSNIALSGLFGSALVVFLILKLSYHYALSRRFGRHFQAAIELEQRTLKLYDKHIELTSSLRKPSTRQYKEIKKIVLDGNVGIIIGRSGWFEMIPFDCIIEGAGQTFFQGLAKRCGKKIISAKESN